MNPPEYCYVGRKPCGCTVAACMDMPKHKKDVAKFLADCVKDGLTIERVTLDDARCTLKRCECKQGVELPLFKG